MNTHPSERTIGSDRFPTGREAIELATRCYCFSSSSSRSAQSDNRIAATDQSTVAGGSGRIVESGAVSVADTGALNTGLQIQAGGAVTIEGTGDLLADANREWLGALDRVTNANAQTSQSVLRSVLESVGGLAEQRITDGEAQTKRYLFWAGAGLLVLGGLYVVKKS